MTDSAVPKALAGTKKAEDVLAEVQELAARARHLLKGISDAADRIAEIADDPEDLAEAVERIFTFATMAEEVLARADEAIEAL